MTAARAHHAGKGPDGLSLHAPEPGWAADGALPPALSSGPDAAKLFKGLQRRWLPALGLGLLLAGAAATGAWYGLTPLHTATMQVHVSFFKPVVGLNPVESQREFGVFQ